eukprot:6023864-Pyramimonas_sp.AAC.1
MKWARQMALFSTGTCTESDASLDLYVHPLLFVISDCCAATCSCSMGRSLSVCRSVGLAGRQRTTWWWSGSSPGCSSISSLGRAVLVVAQSAPPALGPANSRCRCRL